MAFTVNQRAWESGMRMYDDQLQRERQAVIDKRAEEEWGFRKEDREKSAKKERELNAAYEAGIRAAESGAPDTSRANQWLNVQTGAQPPQQAQPEIPQHASVVDGLGAGQTAVTNNAVVQAGVPGGSAPAMPGAVSATQGKAPVAVNPERARAIQSMKLAQLTNNPQAFAQAQATLDAVDKQSEYAVLASQAMNMTPEQRQKVVGALDMNPGYKMSAQVDPKTQITSLRLEDGGEVRLNPAQLARVLVGKYKIDKGDLSGVADIEAVDAKLADRIVKDNNALREVTSTNNQGVTQAANIEIARNQDRRAGASLGIQAAAARRTEEEFNRKRAQEDENKGLSMALYLERNPKATEAELKAVGAGIMPAVPKEDSKYRVDGGEVARVLGRPALGANGEPAINRQTGEQKVNRDLEREGRFYRFMKDNNLTDSDRALVMFHEHEARTRAQTVGEKPKNGAPYPDGTEVIGKDKKRYVIRDGLPVPM